MVIQTYTALLVLSAGVFTTAIPRPTCLLGGRAPCEFVFHSQMRNFHCQVQSVGRQSEGPRACGGGAPCGGVHLTSSKPCLPPLEVKPDLKQQQPGTCHRPLHASHYHPAHGLLRALMVGPWPSSWVSSLVSQKPHFVYTLFIRVYMLFLDLLLMITNVQIHS